MTVCVLGVHGVVDRCKFEWNLPVVHCTAGEQNTYEYVWLVVDNHLGLSLS